MGKSIIDDLPEAEMLRRAEMLNFEKLFYGNDGIESSELETYLQLLRQTREIGGVKQGRGVSAPFDLINMRISKNFDGEVEFDGAISNGRENRIIEGTIKTVDNGKCGYYIVMYIDKLNGKGSCKERGYYVYEEFVEVDGKLVRKTYDIDDSCRPPKFTEDSSATTYFDGIDMESFAEFKKRISGVKMY